MTAEKSTKYADALYSMLQKNDWPQTGVEFSSSNTELVERMDALTKLCEDNIKYFLPDVPVLIEGGGYNRIYLETQPMGGQAYARMNVRPGLNNQIIFLLKQRADGRLPGAVVPKSMVTKDNRKDIYLWSDADTAEYDLVSDFGMLQGNALPYQAFLHYYWAGKPVAYLEALAAGIQAFDEYLWRTRDPDGEGVLQSWAIWDTGEDNSTRFYASPNRWPHDYPPTGSHTPDRDNPEDAMKYYLWFHLGEVEDKVVMPFRSMDMMAYSAENRATLAMISDETGDGKGDYWREQLEAVRQNFTKALWRPERGAAYDRDCNNAWLDVLIHNNLRCMYYKLFTQEQAGEFVKRHLFNPDEFFTPMPLPSIAANEPLFRDNTGNNWSGAPQGLTWQRLVRALENYGLYAELTRLGRMFIKSICKIKFFPSQFDAFKFGDISEEDCKKDGYGPTMLAFLDYVSRLHGVCLERDNVFWSGLSDAGHEHSYTQCWNGHKFMLKHTTEGVEAWIDGKQVFSASPNFRVVTDLNGKVKTIIGIAEEPVEFSLSSGEVKLTGTLQPNEVRKI